MAKNIPSVTTVRGGKVGATGIAGDIPTATGPADGTDAFSTSETVILPPGPLPFIIYKQLSTSFITKKHKNNKIIN